MVCFYLKITWNVTVFMIYIKVIHSNLIHQNIWNSEKWYNIFTSLFQPESGFALLKGALPICGNKCWRLELSTNLKSKKCTKHWYDDDKEMIEYFPLVSVEGAFVIAIVSSSDIFKDEIIIFIKFCQFSSIFLLYWQVKIIYWPMKNIITYLPAYCYMTEPNFFVA